MNKGFWKLQRRGWLVRDLRTDDVVSSFLSYASYGARETWNLETLMYTDIQTNKGTGQRIRKEKPNRAKMGRGVLTPTSQGARQRSPIALRATLEPLLHLFLWVLVSRLIHCRQHQHSLALPSTQWHEKIQAQWLQSLYLPWLKVAFRLCMPQESNFRQHL